MEMPPVDVVRRVLTALADQDVVAAIGGSGLLAALGLTDRVGDWDVTTDATPEAVRAALVGTGLAFTDATVRDGAYATQTLYRVDGGDHQVDVIVGFAAHGPDGVEAFPTRVTGEWNGLPIGDPAVWAQAYRVIGRTEKADLLDEWLRTSGGA